MKDWKTTVPGLIGAFFSFVSFAGSQIGFPEWLVLLAAFVGFGGLGILGINAAQVKKPVDSSVTKP